MIRDLIASTEIRDDALCLSMSDEVYSAMIHLRQFLYENVYRSPKVHRDFEKSKKILSELYAYFLENEDLLHRNLKDLNMLGSNHNQPPKARIVCDFIASMTDRYAMNLYQKLFFPSPLV
jgi:dGTPase